MSVRKTLSNYIPMKLALIYSIHLRFFCQWSRERRTIQHWTWLSFYIYDFASTPEWWNGNINFNKYLIFSSEDRTHNQSRLQSHLFPCATHDWPYWPLDFDGIIFFYTSYYFQLHIYCQIKHDNQKDFSIDVFLIFHACLKKYLKYS